jgi:hypothetical protein
MSNTFDTAALFLETDAELAKTLGPEVSLYFRIALTIPCTSYCRESLPNALIQLLANARDALPMEGAISLAAL